MSRLAIALDGHDGSGKTTLARRVAAELCAVYVGPYGSPFGDALLTAAREANYTRVLSLSSEAISVALARVPDSCPVVFDRCWLTALPQMPPSPVRPPAMYCSLRCAPPYADGVRRRHPSGAAVFNGSSRRVRAARPAVSSGPVGAFLIMSVLSSSPALSRVLSRDDLVRVAPSIFAESARPGVSSRYSFVSTAQVVEVLDAEGWSPVLARQQAVRLEGRQGFQLHEVRFARRDDLSGAREIGDTRPELVLQNSHDGTRAYRIDAGLY